MIEAWYLACAFAMLAFYERPLSVRPSETEKVLLVMIRGSAEIFLTALVLTAAADLLEKGVASRLEGEILIPSLVLFSFFAARSLKKDRHFFLAVLAFSFFAAVPAPGQAGEFSQYAGRLVMLCFIYTAARFGLEGLRFRLLFSSPPRRLEGSPLILFAFSLFLMALSVLKTVWG